MSKETKKSKRTKFGNILRSMKKYKQNINSKLGVRFNPTFDNLNKKIKRKTKNRVSIETPFSRQKGSGKVLKRRKQRGGFFGMRMLEKGLARLTGLPKNPRGSKKQKGGFLGNILVDRFAGTAKRLAGGSLKQKGGSTWSPINLNAIPHALNARRWTQYRQEY